MTRTDTLPRGAITNEPLALGHRRSRQDKRETFERTVLDEHEAHAPEPIPSFTLESAHMSIPPLNPPRDLDEIERLAKEERFRRFQAKLRSTNPDLTEADWEALADRLAAEVDEGIRARVHASREKPS